MRVLFISFLFLFSTSLLAQIKSAKPWLGIAIGKGVKGVYVKQALPDTPAQKGEIKKGDEVLSIDGKKVKTPGELIKAVTEKGVGLEVKVELLRGSKILFKKFTLVAKPEVEEMARKKLLNLPAPAFNLPVIQGSNKKTLSLENQKGKLTLLEFWSVTCPACISAHPRLIDFAKRHKKSVDIISISADKKNEIRKYLGKVDKILKSKDREIIFLNSPDGKVNGEYMANSIPMFVLVDKEGKVVDVGIGAGRVLERVLKNIEDRI
jgi:thiol-disulfide isomerase/thioredoxin